MNHLESEDLRTYKANVGERLAALMMTFKKAAGGDFAEKIKVPKKQDEWRELFLSLKTMLGELKKRTKAVKNKEIIQTKALQIQEERRAVAERTAKNLKEEVAKKTETLKESDRLRERFMADASHELRTPLTVLQTNLDVLDSLRTKRVYRQEMGEILESSKNQIRSLTGILEELSLLSKGKKPEELRETVNLGGIIQATIEELRPLVEAKGIKCNVDIQSQGLEVMGDGAMIKKLVINLVSNAIKYGKQQGTIAITLSRYGSGEGVLEVKDDGIGIPKKDLSFVFERFYRVDSGRTKEKGGVGLGLAICKWVAELHGGRIEVKSTHGKGSKFRAYLPLKGSLESKVGFWDYRARKFASQ